MKTDRTEEGRFVGRAEEIAAFEKVLQNPYGEERQIFVWGPGGIGKTWLVRHLLEVAAQNNQDTLVLPHLIDMYSTGSQHIEGVMDAIVERLERQTDDDIFTSYHEAHQELQKARQVRGYSSEGIEDKLAKMQAAFRHCLGKVVVETPVVLALDTFEHVHNTPVEAWVVSEDGLQMPGLVCIIAGRTPNPLNQAQAALGGLSDEAALDLYDQYTGRAHERTPEQQTFVHKLNEKADHNPLLLSLAFTWLDFNALPPEKLDEVSQIEFEKNIASWFHPSRGAGSLYLGTGEIDEAVGQTLILMAYLNRRFNHYFLERLVAEEFIIGADSDAIWREITHNLYITRQFFFVKDRPEGEIQLHDKLAEMLRLYVLPDAFDDLSGERLQQLAHRVISWYEDLIAQTESDNLKNDYRVEQLVYALRLDILSDLQQPGIAKTTEGRRLKHLLPPDFPRAQTLLGNFWNLRSDVLDRLILNQLKPQIVAQLPLIEQYELSAALGSMARRIHALTLARTFWRVAVTAAQELSEPEKEVRAMNELSGSTWQEDLSQSLVILNDALEIAQKKATSLLPTILYSIGITYRRMEALEEANEWYEKAQRSARELQDKEITPTILNDKGYALWLARNDAQAQPLVEIAAQLRERRRDELQTQLNSQVKKLTQSTNPEEKDETQKTLAELKNQLYDATLKLGMSYNTLGQLARYTGELANAEDYYDDALSIFEAQESNYWRIEALQSRGDAYRQLAKNLYTLERREKSREYDKKAYNDLEAAMVLCEQYGFIEISARVHRRIGRLLHDRYFRTDDLHQQETLLKEALAYFEDAIQIAQKTGSTLEELEALTEIAFLGDDLVRLYKQQEPYDKLQPEEHELVQQYTNRLRQGIEAEAHRDDRPRIYQFDVFDNLLKMEEAALIYESGNFDQALEKYLQSFTGLARDPGYGSARCRRHFDHLFENIRRLRDASEEEKWCRRFMDAWRQETVVGDKNMTLERAHADLFKQFELHIETGFMYT